MCDAIVKLILYAELKKVTCSGELSQEVYFMDETFEIQQASEEGTSPGFGLGAQEALEYRRQLRGMIGVASKVPLKDRSVLSLVYTPGVAAPCLEIAQAPLSSFDYTM